MQLEVHTRQMVHNNIFFFVYVSCSLRQSFNIIRVETSVCELTLILSIKSFNMFFVLHKV